MTEAQTQLLDFGQPSAPVARPSPAPTELPVRSTRTPDLAGQRFGRLMCLGYVGRTRAYKPLWLCRCECGKERVVAAGHLKNGHTRSCGCLARERTRALMTTHALCRDERGKAPRPYGIWARMKQRCADPNVIEFGRYGGRGIKVCAEWLNYKPFHDWAMANGYRDDLTLDRIDNDGNYEPGNCRWASRQEQAAKTCRSVLVAYGGRTQTMAAWATETGIPYSALQGRIAAGWSAERALTAPIRGRGNEVAADG